MTRNILASVLVLIGAIGITAVPLTAHARELRTTPLAVVKPESSNIAGAGCVNCGSLQKMLIPLQESPGFGKDVRQLLMDLLSFSKRATYVWERCEGLELTVLLQGRDTSTQNIREAAEHRTTAMLDTLGANLVAWQGVSADSLTEKVFRDWMKETSARLHATPLTDEQITYGFDHWSYDAIVDFVRHPGKRMGVGTSIASLDALMNAALDNPELSSSIDVHLLGAMQVEAMVVNTLYAILTHPKLAKGRGALVVGFGHWEVIQLHCAQAGVHATFYDTTVP